MNQTHIGQTGPRAFGIAQKRTLQQFIKPDYPGPGTHEEIRMNESNPPTWKFGYSTERNGFLCQTTKSFPSSNKYQPNPQFIKTAYPKYSIPRATRRKDQVDQNSRMEYNPKYKHCRQKQPNWSFGYSEQRDYGTSVPPPNTYFEHSIQASRFNKTQNFFTRTSRHTPPYHEQAKFPGVGQYKIDTLMRGTSYKFGSGDRHDQINGKDSPGIFYDIAGQIKQAGAGCTLRKKFPLLENKDSKDFPSPNQYNPNALKSGRNIISYRGSRSTMHNKHILKYPSPDKYSNHSNIEKQTKKKSQSFTVSERQPIKDNGNPAPNVYKIDKELNKTLGNMGCKLKSPVQYVTPAPSCYTPNDQLTKVTPQRPINLQSGRVDFSKCVTGKDIGPGSYLKQPQWSKAELGKLSKSMKLSTGDMKVPGPGAYDIPGAFGKLPKYYCLPRKLDDKGHVLDNSVIMKSTEKTERMKKFEQSLNKASPKRHKSMLAKHIDESPL